MADWLLKPEMDWLRPDFVRQFEVAVVEEADKVLVDKAAGAGEEGAEVVASDHPDHIVLLHFVWLVDLGGVMSVPWSSLESHKGRSKRMVIEHDLKTIIIWITTYILTST